MAASAFPFDEATSSWVAHAKSLADLGHEHYIHGMFNGNTPNERIGWAASGTKVEVALSGGTGAATLNLGNAAVSAEFKAAYGYKTDDAAGSLDGAAVVTDTSYTADTDAATLRIGYHSSVDRAFLGYIYSLTNVPRDYSDAELIAKST
jgi:hypothetical protein